jgi:ABC-type Fe3+-hydroxamate transport system substrate-binding protein
LAQKSALERENIERKYRNMLRSIILTALLLLLIEGCSSYSSVTSENCDKVTNSEIIYKIEKRNGSIIEFSQDSSRQARIQDSVLIGMQTNGSPISIPVTDVNRIYTKHPSTTATIVNVGIVTVGIGGVIYVVTHHGAIFSGPLFGGSL